MLALAGSHRNLDECRQYSFRNCNVYTYENLMSNNFRKTAVLKKKMNCKPKLHVGGRYCA